MKIALVQFYPYHEEVLAPQIHYLLPDNEIFVAAPASVFKNDYIAVFDSEIHQLQFTDKRYGRKLIDVFFRIASIILKYIQLKRSISENDIRLIIFNTLSKPFHLNLIKLFFRKEEKIHIIHNAQLYIKRRWIKKLSLFRKNLFISKDVYEYYVQKYIKEKDRGSFDWFLPGLSFFLNSADGNVHIDSSLSLLALNKINIVVPGSVEYHRRNYEGLFQALEKYKDKKVPFQIILLGKSSVDILKYIDDIGLKDIVFAFSEYISGKVMLNYITHADGIAFLIDRDIGENCSLYNTYKATGTSVLCLSFHVPCIVSSDFNLDKSLKNKAIVYPENHIEKFLLDMICSKITKQTFADLRIAPVDDLYSEDYQKKHYRNLIGCL